MNKKVVIFGAAALARLAHFYLSEDSPYEVAAFTVNEEYLDKKKFMGLDVVPFERMEEMYPPEQFAMFVAIGYRKVNKGRAEVYNRCKGKGYELISYVSSKVMHWDHMEIGDNCFIYGATIIQPFARIGNNVVLGSASVGHDANIGDHCYIASHAVIAGDVTIGPYCFVGVNSTIRNGITVAPECIIGAGAIILKNTQEGRVYPGQNAAMSPIPSSELRSFQ